MTTRRRYKAFTVSLCGSSSKGGDNNKLDVFSATKFFYEAPITKFYLSLIVYVAYISLFTYVVLDRLRPFSQFYNKDTAEMNWYFAPEIIVWFWHLSYLLEEMREIAARESESLLTKLTTHLRSFWNVLDVVLDITLTVAVILRLQDYVSNDRAVKVMYALCLLLEYLRTMQLFYVSKVLGPKIIMIQRMLKDVAFFLSILVIFILAFGVAMQALLYPYNNFSIIMLRDAFYTPFFQMFGELFIERVEGVHEGFCISNHTESHETGDLPHCPEQNALVPVLFGVYMLLTNVLLLNLLIAMFSYSFQSVQERSEKVWRFYRYYIISSYYETPAIRPPFLIFAIVYRLFRYIYKKLTKQRDNDYAGFRVRFNAEDNLKLSAFERHGKECLITESNLTSGDSDVYVGTVTERLSRVIDDLEEVKEAVQAPTRSQVSTTNGETILVQPQQSSVYEDRLAELDAKVQLQNDVLKELLRLLRHKSDQ